MIKFEPRDLWIGVYWNFEPVWYADNQWNENVLNVFICIIPCFPIHLTYRLSR